MKRSARGLTLLEMVIVLVVLTAVASMAVDLLDNRDLQARYDDTKNRAQALHDGTVGRPERTLNGQAEISGFVADMGRLPSDGASGVAELVSQATVAGPPLFDSTYMPLTGDSTLVAGWRGPYVRGQGMRFRDGWGADWIFARSIDASTGWPKLIVGSLGSDATVGGATWDALDYSVAVMPDDYSVLLEGWRVTVRFTDASGADASYAGTIPPRLRLWYPTSPDGGGPTTATFVDVDGVQVGTSSSWTFTFPTTTLPTAQVRVPIGVRTFTVVDSSTGATYQPGLNRAHPFAFVPRVALPPALTLTWRVS